MTDRVELTEEERAHILLQAQQMELGLRTDDAFIAHIESIVAARLEPMQVATDTYITEGKATIAALRAELAAAKERGDEYKKMLRAVMDPLTWAEYHAERCGAVEGAQQMKGERDALQATLDRVAALADEWEAEDDCLPASEAFNGCTAIASERLRAIANGGTE
jgi:hypothetical protein